MKKIYAFTLDNDDYPSEKYRHDLRLIAYMLYDSIYNYDGENFTALIINKNIKYNDIHEGYRDGEYYLDSDEFDNGYIYYEPFLIGERSFALTINDDIMSEDVVCSLLNYTLNLLGFGYKFSVKTICYFSKNNEDERNRSKAISLLSTSLGCEPTKKNYFAKKRIMSGCPWKNTAKVLRR